MTSIEKGIIVMVSLLLGGIQTAKAQLYFEDFEGAAPGVSLNTMDQGSAGSGGDNYWIINDDYGQGPTIVMGQTVDDTPNQPGGINSAPQSNYLHITSNIGTAYSPPLQSAHVDPSSTNGESYFTEIATGVSSLANPGVELHFWFLNSATDAEAQVWAKDGPGGTWTQLNAGDFTTALSNTTNNWDSTTYKGNQLQNMADIYLGFRYVYDNGNAPPYYPSFSVDDITVALPDVVEAEVIAPAPLPTYFCPGDQVTFEALTNAAIGNYQWNFNGGSAGVQTVNGPSTVNFTAGNPGSYTFELQVTDGINQDVFQWPVTIIPCDPPDIAITANPRTLCAGQGTNFQDMTIPGSAPIQSIEWTFPGGNPGTSTGPNPIVTYNAVGTYDVTLQVTDSLGTYDSTFVNYIEVEACPPPIADFDVVGDNREICPGTCLGFQDLSANMTGAGLLWEWEFEGADSTISNQQNPQNICYPNPGLFRVTLRVTNSVGSDSKSVAGYIRVDSCMAPEVDFSVQRDSICMGTCIQFVNRTRNLNPDSTYWTFPGADAPYTTSRETEPIVCYSDTGRYDVTLEVINDFGTDAEIKTGFIYVMDYPRVEIVNPETGEGFEDNKREILIDRSARLRALGDGGSRSTFGWTPAEDINCTNCQTVTVTPKENRFYYVTHTNKNGCSSTDSVRVLVRKEYYAGVPEAFSPNGDGMNDELFVRGNGITDLQFFVYNRHGEKIFESFSQDNGWDGTYKGRRLDPGVFVYFARITYLSGYQEVIKGEVNLIR